MANYSWNKPVSPAEIKNPNAQQVGQPTNCTTRQASVAGLMLPVVMNYSWVADKARLRRLDIAALAVLLLCNISILLFLRVKRKRAEKALPWISWKEGRPAPSNDHTAANQALLQWGVLAAAGLLGASYSWITGQWIILPFFLAGGYWIGTRARGLLHH
ncbi:MAG: hypothetical protein KGM47_07300 [Acidobacteriota bacterium]|nr:hypothetical protein [Acidobacteriota bacterium]